MNILAVCCGAIGFFLISNLLFSLLYMLSKSAGKGFYRWTSHDDLEILVIVTAPLFGLTQYVASTLYEKYNWFKARILLILYSILLVILAILFFILFDLL
ncbi:hypothetical protein FBF83_09085 [Pseudalkalibacillus hwajinpoensis]|uniref:Uncharacterized protein n=1 Tax=Guptibacillus hwajinpoensis TaxID=208199 RepID=A0A4V5PYN0_9BACL|nr:hypothetical protein FBF83_09085 [Pseudalkalibacillus hwajinpoensis]